MFNLNSQGPLLHDPPVATRGPRLLEASWLLRQKQAYPSGTKYELYGHTLVLEYKLRLRDS